MSKKVKTSMAVTEPVLETHPIDAIRPYWRNPRVITEAAVSGVAESIEKYGYRNPIVVDEDLVIINGHTRYAALRRLKIEEVPVIVARGLDPAEVKEYRVLDNRLHEYSSWDEDSLVLELREFEQALTDLHFPEIDLKVGDLASAEFTVTSDDMDKATQKVTTSSTYQQVETISLTCPSCFHEFEVKSDTL